MRYLLALAVLMLGVATPSYATWPTIYWKVLEQGGKEPLKDNRKLFAQKYKKSLEESSIWLQSMSFKAPFQINEKDRLDFKSNEHYLAFLASDTSSIGSSHTEHGYMHLSTYPSFLKPKDSFSKLFEAATVHELFHGIQKAHPNYYKYATSEPHGPQECNDASRADGWVTEGTAAAVQIQYLEQAQGDALYGHAFNGSEKATFVRFFDQPLDWGKIPDEYHGPSKPMTPQLSWKCSYGSWYFWYAVGNMLGSKNPQDWRRTAYLRYIFEQKGNWQGTGLAMVDSGLKWAAQELDAIDAYQGGLFALYPRFVAQYLDVDRFYENVENVTMATPSLYEATSSMKGSSPIEPIATRAWRFRIQLPHNFTPIIMPYSVRFVLESPHQDSLDGLHLIVDNKVIDRPKDPQASYSHTRRTDENVPSDQTELEYFVRIANVAQDAATTQPAEFTLRVEVEGFYGGKTTVPLGVGGEGFYEEKKTGPSNNAIVSELPPGFKIAGPGKYWTCSGGDDARAAFTMVTPDGHADQIERILLQGFKNTESGFDRAEIQAHDKGQDAELHRIQQQRKHFESRQAALQNSGVEAKIARAADESRRKTETFILAKLYGNNTAGTCNVIVSATLPGRQLAAQRIPGDHFNVQITPESWNDMRAEMVVFAGTLDFSKIDLANMTEEQIEHFTQKYMQNPMVNFDEIDSDWLSCSTNQKNCDAGELNLEHAWHDHLSGTFKFQVWRRDEESHDIEYDTVTGFINITSAQTEHDNTLLDFMSRGQQIGEPFYAPGIEKLLQGGFMFGD